MSVVDLGQKPAAIIPFGLVKTLVIDGGQATAAGFPAEFVGLALGGFMSETAGGLNPRLRGLCALVGTVNSRGELSGAVIALADIEKLQAALGNLRDALIDEERAGGAVQ